MEPAYAAGIIDGEGHIKFSVSQSGILVLRVIVGNTSLDLITALRDNYDGSVHEAKRQQKYHKQAYIWTLTGKHAALFLASIYPHLIIKKRQATLAILFWQQRPSKENGEVIDFFRETMKKYNERSRASSE